MVLTELSQVINSKRVACFVNTKLFTFIYNYYNDGCLSKLRLEHTIIDSEILLPPVNPFRTLVYLSYGILYFSHGGLVDFNNDTIVVH